MKNYVWNKFIAELAKRKATLCLVGGGGKTSIMYELAAKLTSLGRKVLVLTSTHIYQPAPELYAASEAAAQKLWQEGSFAVIGTIERDTNKLTPPGSALYSALRHQADIVLCEADGAKHLPCKVPAAHEPALLKECDIVLAVCGLDALGKPLAEVVFRAPLAAALLDVHEKTLLTAPLLARILTNEQVARKNVGSREYYVVLNKCELVTKAQVHELCSSLLAAGLKAEQVLLRSNFGKE